jgi:hypothetical protein
MSAGIIPYDFENQVPAAVVAALKGLGLTAYVVADEPQFQRQRPRTEVVFKNPSAAVPIRFALVPPNNTRAVQAYKGDLQLTSITPADEPGKSLTAAYRAQLRQVMEIDFFRAAANVASNPYTFDFVLPTGSEERINTADGYQITRLTYSVEFSIKLSAFTFTAQ